MSPASIFGDLVTAQSVNSTEEKATPVSIHTLNAQSAVVLKSFMECRPNDFAISRFLFSEIAILWAVNRDNEIKFALEEAVSEENENIRFPKPKRLRISYLPFTKIGHPGLVGPPFEARISGDIYFDASPRVNRWVITNQSGRFGLNCGRLESQLIAVAERFAHYGINLTPYFIQRAAR
jgi:hypothetical protein